MTGHENLHRRHARAANPFPNPFANANPFANSFPNPFANPDPAVSTVVSVVYSTLPATFTGPIGGYYTKPQDTSTTPTEQSTTPTPTTQAKTTNTNTNVIGVDTTSSTPAKTASPSTLQTTGIPTEITNPSSTVAGSIGILAASGGISSSSSTKAAGTASAASSTATGAPSSGGMSAGGKAGLAIGIILLLGAVLSIVLFCFKKRREAARDRLDDEKHEFAAINRAASTRTTATAPRVSLRPVTQFMPTFGEKRQSRGNALMTTAGPIAEKPSAWERPNLTPQSNRDNPFGNHAVTIDATNAKGPDVVQDMGPSGEIITGGVVAGAAAGLARGASKRGNGPKPMDFTKNGPFMGPPSPAGTEFSSSSESAATPTQTGTGAAIAAAGGPVNTAVHRVQLDFKPSMEDELELRAGQLIRLLHEYDDGWALCIRLDRSQQGVVPRTCLSTRPVKPRPQQNGPRGPPIPGMRVPQQRPMSPAGQMSPRPMTPNGQQQRPMPPGGQGRPGSPSASQMQGRRNSPPGPSPMHSVPQSDGAGSPSHPHSLPETAPYGPRGPPQAPVGRKPVPGQAM